MEGEKAVLHMNLGDGENSYAKNSTCQKIWMMKTRHVLEYSLKKSWNHYQLPKCFRMADLGCSSGPNALLSISYAIDVIDQICQQYNLKMPEFQVFLNDLLSNDFNQLFKLLPHFHEKLKEEKGTDYCCFISGVPGSYYHRLFPSNSLHFVSCINGVHWLSKVPEGLENNRGNIHLAKSSPRDVFEAYLKQFQEDFFNFLRFRGQEIKPGGVMILAYLGRSTPNPFIKDAIEILAMLAEILLQMATEGLV
ncbi:benzoate carboxyl methyltransferase-like isoform X2 [Lycium ferocissimum]|uniref:benzoate carboxyl methyltransferase-like isoform X2 n=1 Tax=Lycium ferocissimum TaxID=112874 RepID=UPI002814F043|nr:benzoate carboxyl methyltransferase-like isoform X2 [Lycium ferocissimum]